MLQITALLVVGVAALGADAGITRRWTQGYAGTISNADCGGEVTEEGPACMPSCTIDLKFPVELRNLNSGMAYPTTILDNDRTTWSMVARETHCKEGEITDFEFNADFMTDYRNETLGIEHNRLYLTIPPPTLILS